MVAAEGATQDVLALFPYAVVLGSFLALVRIIVKASGKSVDQADRRAEHDESRTQTLIDKAVAASEAKCKVELASMQRTIDLLIRVVEVYIEHNPDNHALVALLNAINNIKPETPAPEGEPA